eukprot:CAMPEP_0119092360 /NCGR_PEP_ID=MMETSP1178-20130426/159481_1 /TAXON_ID=33656 /ORGANISM="unid sp, Strain CCMP2000" /LENGTH=111 /DNA_ID=CAMNT_0007075929 /DNA_START=276 /DNA_END=612 /DNA_ORIENTATION=+
MTVVDVEVVPQRAAHGRGQPNLLIGCLLVDHEGATRAKPHIEHIACELDIDLLRRCLVSIVLDDSFNALEHAVSGAMECLEWNLWRSAVPPRRWHQPDRAREAIAEHVQNL